MARIVTLTLLMCGFTLAGCTQSTSAVAATPSLPAAEIWQCPMHPSVVQDHPGNCPICSMKLVRVSTAAKTGSQAIHLDSRQQKLLGVKMATASRGPLEASVKLAARVGVNETKVRSLSLKVSGHVEKLFVDFVGKPVRQGQPLFALASPELIAAQEEYLLSLRGPKAVAAAARRRLELWDMPQVEIARLEREGMPLHQVTFFAPASGVVTRKDVVLGSHLEAGAMPLEWVDLSSVWVWAEIYAGDLSWVKPGLSATVQFEGLSGAPYSGTVQFVDVAMNGATRTARLRVELPNRDGQLKPEMYGEMTLQRPARDVLRVPTDALIRTGHSAVVFVSQGDGHFQPTPVELGEVTATFAEIRGGIVEGASVATSANFLLDSEAQLRAAVSRWSAGGP